MQKLKRFCSDNIGFTFVLPALIFYTVFSTVSIVVTFYFSLFNWSGIGFNTMEFVGTQNFLEVFTDRDFWNAMRNNAIWMMLSVTIPIALSLMLAIMLSQRKVKGKTFFRTVYFLPLMLSLPAVGSIWQFVYNPHRGVIVWFMRFFGASDAAFTWLADPVLVIPAVFIASMWGGFGFNIVIFIAALQGVDPTYYESALLDGANRIQMTIKITLPLIKGVFTMVILNTIIGSFRVFDIIFTMTGGGPFRSSEVVAIYMFNQTFRHLRVGYGSAIGMVFTAMICVISVIFLRLTRKED